MNERENFYVSNVVFADRKYQQFYVQLSFNYHASGGGSILYNSYKICTIPVFGESICLVTEKKSDGNSVSAFEALMVSTASRMGTGNIVGVANAIAIGGYGAVFWMWVIALVGGASAFVESTLAQIYKKRDKDSGSYGGPAYYIEVAMGGKRWLGVIFAVALIATYAGGFNMLCSYISSRKTGAGSDVQCIY